MPPHRPTWAQHKPTRKGGRFETEQAEGLRIGVMTWTTSDSTW